MVPVDFSYTTFYRLSIVTFALEGRTVKLQYITLQTTTDGRNTVPITRPLARSDKKTLTWTQKLSDQLNLADVTRKKEKKKKTKKKQTPVPT